MPNPFTNTYMPNGFEGQDQQGFSPVFQNVGQQQQFQNQQLGAGNQLAQQVGQGQGSGFNNLAMAMALRNKQPQTGASIGDKMSNYFGTQQTPEMQAQINQLGSNTWNPMSDYNTGANGWGSYGE